VTSPGHPARPPRAAALLAGRVENLRDFSQGGREDGRRERIFVFGGPKPKILPSRETWRAEPATLLQTRWRKREPKNSRLFLVLPSSRPPCEKISLVRGGLSPLQQLLRVRLRIGSPRRVKSCGARSALHGSSRQLAVRSHFGSRRGLAARRPGRARVSAPGSRQRWPNRAAKRSRRGGGKLARQAAAKS